MTVSNAPIPEVGEPAPDFTLPSTDGVDVTLSDLRGRPALIAFFPLAFTSTCTRELCDMRDDWGAFAAAAVRVLPTSVDSIPTLAEFRRRYRLTVDFLSDFRRDVSRRYGVLLEDRFYSNRAYFLVDRDGVLRWRHVEANPGQKRTNDELLDHIRALG